MFSVCFCSLSGVYHQCQCSLFKQFTTCEVVNHFAVKVFIINVNVLFLSNSQPRIFRGLQNVGVYHQCQCSLFKQFTTIRRTVRHRLMVFIINVNVLFLSNSQLNSKHGSCINGVYHQCQCSLFKQFTTGCQLSILYFVVFIINVNVLFLSNSQLNLCIEFCNSWCLSSMSMFSF